MRRLIYVFAVHYVGDARRKDLVAFANKGDEKDWLKNKPGLSLVPVGATMLLTD